MLNRSTGIAQETMPPGMNTPECRSPDPDSQQERQRNEVMDAAERQSVHNLQGQHRVSLSVRASFHESKRCAKAVNA
jgi:hypothetical protein